MVETAQAGHQPRRGAGVIAVVEAPAEVLENQLAIDPLEIEAALHQPVAEQRQVGAIGQAGMPGQALFQPE
ncbi:hypothetical protein D3C86_2006810 [compost metagenome]